jgi:pimeloyl-ACP methyl ester carboxylesterase
LFKTFLALSFAGMKVYFISGLGADSRVFKYIQLPAHCEAVYLDWIKPMKDEKLKDYSLRFAKKIDVTEPFAIVGLSMGGMMATEIAVELKPAATILISSIPLSKQLPFYFRIAGKMNIHKLVPLSLIKSAVIAKRFFTTETNDDKTIIAQMVKDMDANFIRWAMNAVVNWKNETKPVSYTHIHGKKDGILPMRLTKPTHIIPGGGHLIIMTRAKKVNGILAEILKRTD